MIVQNILVHEIIVKRQLPLNHIIEGLGSMDFLPVLQAFSEEFECMFVPGTSLGPTCEELGKMLRKDASVTSEISFGSKTTFKHLMEMVRVYSSVYI